MNNRTLTLSIFLILSINCFSQEYPKTKYINQEQQAEYQKLQNLPADSLFSGLNKCCNLYESTKNIGYLYLSNNYLSKLIYSKVQFDAISYLKQLKDLAIQYNDTLTEEYAFIYVEEANYYYHIKFDFTTAATIYKHSFKLLNIVETESDKPVLGVLLKIANSYQNSKDYLNSIQTLKQLITLSKERNQPVYEVRSYLLLNSMIANSNPNIDKDILERGIHLNVDRYFSNLIKSTYYKLKSYTDITTDYKGALQACDSAFKYGIDKIYGQIKTNLDKSSIYSGIGNDSLALVYYITADSLYKCLEPSQTELYYMQGMGGFCYNNHLYKEAEIHFNLYINTLLNNGINKNNLYLIEAQTTLERIYAKLQNKAKADELGNFIADNYFPNQPVDSLIKKLDYKLLDQLSAHYISVIYNNCYESETQCSIDSLLSLYESLFKISDAIYSRFEFNTYTLNRNSYYIRNAAQAMIGLFSTKSITDEQMRNFWILTSSLKSYDLVSKVYTPNNSIESSLEYRRFKVKLAASKNDLVLYNKIYNDYVDFCIDEILSGFSAKQNPFDTKILTERFTDTRKLIDTSNNELILDIYVSDSTLSCFAVYNGQIKLYTSLFHDSNHDLNNLYKDLKTQNYSGNIIFKSTDELINKVIADYPVIKKIHIISEQQLLQLPFELISYNNKYLIESFPVSYNYSSSLLYRTMKSKTPDDYSLLALAPVFDKDNQNMELSLQRSIDDNDTTISRDGKTYQALPFTRVEVDNICNLFLSHNEKAKALIAQNATENAFRSNMNNYNIIHLATHGYSSSTQSELSNLVVCENESKQNTNTDNDGVLFYHEIFDLQLNANLVVLSACKTGTGKLVDGEGIMALPRGFIYAGVPNVIASLWKVHDERTKDLMVAFYNHLIDDKVTYSEALRLAKLDCIKKGFTPLDWAGFVLIGN